MPRFNQMTAVAFSDILGCGLGLGLEVHGLGLEGHDLGLGVVALLTSLQFYTANALFVGFYCTRSDATSPDRVLTTAL